MRTTEPPVKTYANENPNTCLYCGARTEALTPIQMDEDGDRFENERCLGCG